MGDHKPSIVAPKALGVVDGSAYPQAENRVPTIALGTMRSTMNALRTRMNREGAAHTIARSLVTHHRSRVSSRLQTKVFILPRRGSPESVRGFALLKQRERFSAFTLAELLVSMGVLVLLVLLFTQLLNSAATITTLGHKQVDADSQARELLDRISVDFAKMVKRPDVDYYLKSSAGAASDCGVCGSEVGNDQAAFYTSTPGYYPTVPTPAPSYTQRSPLSVVVYRINSDSSSSFYNRMQRMGKGLPWNGASTGWTPVVFLPQTINGNWSYATSTSLDDSSYEIIGPQVFRFEYYYLLKNGTLSSTPWYTAPSVRGMRDVTAIIADIAVIDPKSKVLADNSAQVPAPDDNITRLAGQLVDYSSGLLPGQLLANWRASIDANSIGLPRPAISGIRVYERCFYLNQ